MGESRRRGLRLNLRGLFSIGVLKCLILRFDSTAEVCIHMRIGHQSHTEPAPNQRETNERTRKRGTERIDIKGAGRMEGDGIGNDEIR